MSYNEHKQVLDNSSVVMYIRTSTQEQEPKNQIKACQAINKWGDYILLEEKQSAWQDFKERKEFNKLKDWIIAGKIKHLIVWDLDRVYRSRVKLVQFLELTKNYGCQIHSYNQAWLDNINKIPVPWNEIMYNTMIQIMGYIAEEESNKKSERIKAAIRKRDGKTVSYKGKRWGRKPHPKQFETRVMELYNKGFSLRKIREELKYWDRKGIPRKPSLGLVHKIVSKNRLENHNNNPVPNFR
ncbi:hypothetical protein LCGC14_0534640 [marine sediment metagenome]|uniref:Resolvase/invertase-type recombinase catalytic domain-containing protein n=1 Tax=marine sediment metagenome TaxID=412755 RepID=A0A0F9V2Q1_9ZZZZ